MTPGRSGLDGACAVITGAAGGLGARFAATLCGAGASVALVGRRRAPLEDLARTLSAQGGRTHLETVDVADAAAFAAALVRIEAALGPVSVLVNNAGVGPGRPALDVTESDFEAVFSVNVRGLFFAAQAAARRMIANGTAGTGRARIVNVASIAARTPLSGLSLYSASKAAVVMLTRSLAREWARPGIAVNALSPGYVETPLNADWFASDGGRRQASGFPRRRLMPAGALDEALLLLCGPSADWITGTILEIDDGQTL